MFVQAAADIACITQSHYLLCLPLQTTMDDKDSGQVVSAVNCYFMCQVGSCNGAFCSLRFQTCLLVL